MTFQRARTSWDRPAHECRKNSSAQSRVRDLRSSANCQATMLVRDADANSYFESTTSWQTAPAKQSRPQRLIVKGFVGPKSNSLHLFGLEAGEFLNQHIRVRTVAPFERSHAGTEHLGHRVELFAVGNVDD